MAKYRPTGVLVIAILHLIGGGISLVMDLLGCAFLLIGSSIPMFATPPQPPPGSQPRQVEEMKEFNRKVQDLQYNPPGGKVVQFGQTGTDVILSSMMVASGIGLIMMKPWARKLSIAYSICSILLHVVSVVYFFAFMLPAWQAVLAEAPRGDPALGFFTSFVTVALFIVGVGAFLFVAYPIVALFIMLKPSTGAAFRGELDDEGYARPRPVAEDQAEPFGRRDPETRYRREDR